MGLIGGKYKIIKSLGRGGNGQVYLAENTMLHTRWAVKEINKKQIVDYRSEVNILKKLKHKYLPILFDVIKEQESIYLIEEYVEGKSLKEIIKNSRAIKEKDAIEIIKKICEVLNYLHSFRPNPIIYRDLKPSNIMILDNGDIKLLDFGIAREFKENKSEDTVLIGTKGYAAPEQYGGCQTDERSDIYSLGVTTHHMLTGKKPYEPPYEFLPVRKYNESISKKTQTFIDKCLELDPDKRFQSAKEILQYLNTSQHRNKEFLREIKVLGKKNIAVFDNAEFTCELAHVAARFGLKVLIIDLCYFSNILDVFFKNNNSEIKSIEYLLKDENIDCCKELESYIYKEDGLDLYVISNNYSCLNDNLNLNNLKGILNGFHMNFILLNKTLNNSIAKELLQLCDYTLYPQSSDYESTCVFNAIKGYLNNNYLGDKNKLKFIAYEYKQGVNAPLEDVKSLVGKNNYWGYISYDKKREMRRNFFDKITIKKKTHKEYMQILSCMNVV